MKYELTEYIKIASGHTLHRIRATKDFGGIKAGALGGWIRSEENLSQDGNCWVYDEAEVSDGAKVTDDASVRGRAKIREDAYIGDDAEVYGEATVTGEAKIGGSAKVSGHAIIDGNASVGGNAQVSEAAVVNGNVLVTDNAEVSGIVCLFGHMVVGDTARVQGQEDVCMVTVPLLDDATPLTTFYRNVYGTLSVSSSHLFSPKSDRHIREQAGLARSRLAAKGNLQKMQMFDAACEFVELCSKKIKQQEEKS